MSGTSVPVSRRQPEQDPGTLASWCRSLDAMLSRVPIRGYLVFIAALIGLLLLLAGDYGQSWDIPYADGRGLATYNYYFDGFDAQRLRTAAYKAGLYYGSVADVLIKLAQDATPDAVQKFEIRTVLQALITFSSLIPVFLISARVVSKPLALVAVALVAATPLFFGHAFINPKDTIFASGFLWALCVIFACYGGGRRPGYGALIGLGILLGAVTSYRYLGICLFLLVPLLAIVLPAQRPEESGDTGSALASRLKVLTMQHAAGFGVLLLAFVVSYLIFMPDLLSNLRLSEFGDMIRVFAHYPWMGKVRYFGDQLSAQALPWHYALGYLLVQLPLYYHFFLLTLVAAAVVYPRAIARALGDFRQQNYEAFSVVVALLVALLVPLALILVARPALYDGIRHMLFLVPLLCMLLYFGFVGVMALTRGVLAVAMSLIALLFWGQAVAALVRLHPYEYAYLNPLVKPADLQFEMDYWATSFREVARYLNDYPREPGAEKIKLSVCGPPHSITPFLDPQKFEIAAHEAAADIKVLLVRFGCLSLARKPWLFAVQRDNSLFAVVSRP